MQLTLRTLDYWANQTARGHRLYWFDGYALRRISKATAERRLTQHAILLPGDPEGDPRSTRVLAGANGQQPR